MLKLLLPAMLALLGTAAHAQGWGYPPPLPDRTPCATPGANLTNQERSLCLEPMGRTAQDAFLQIYGRLLEIYPVRSVMRENQARWMNTIFRSNQPPSAGWPPTFREAYAARIRDVEWITGRTTEIMAREYTREELNRQCAELPPPSPEPFLLRCRVKGTRDLDGGRFITQHQDWREVTRTDNSDFPNYFSTAVLERTDNEENPRWRLVVWGAADAGSFADFAGFGRDDEREILHIPMAVMNSGMVSQDVLFVRTGDRWREIDATSWVRQLDRRLPRGWRSGSNITLDPATLRARTVLYRPDEPTCCPTGGVAEALLSIVGEALVVTSHRVEPSRPPARPATGQRTPPAPPRRN